MTVISQRSAECGASRTSPEHEGRVAVITGGARGFGQAFGRALAERGAHVVLVDVDDNAVMETASALASEGLSAEAVAADVNDDPQIATMVGGLVGSHGGIDILINNAGLHSQAYDEPMAHSGVPKLRQLMDVNVMGTIICTLAVAPAMRNRPGASIVNISSAAADSCATAYGVSKLAVRGVTVASARELGPDGIRVNAIAPGLIMTDTIRAELDAETVERVKTSQVIRAEGEERDVVEAMLFLVSARARFVTAETLRVGGGLSVQV